MNLDHELTDLLKRIKKMIQPGSDMAWIGGYEKSEDLIKKIQEFIVKSKQGNRSILEELKLEFAPTSTFQEHSMVNGWSDEFLKMAEEFDLIYSKLKER